MASYHCELKVGTHGRAGEHSDYIRREGRYAGGERAEELEATGHGNLPAWADNPRDFWEASDRNERANANGYREYELALPAELNKEQRRELVEEFCRNEFGDKHAHSWGIHVKESTLTGDKQPHAHIQYCDRADDGIERSPEKYFGRANNKHPERGGCPKAERYNGRDRADHVRDVRRDWAELQNKHLERAGYDVRVDHRSLDAQREEALRRGDHTRAAELDRPAEQHLGPRVSGAVAREIRQQQREREAELGRALDKGERAELRREILQKRPEERARITGDVREVKALDGQIAEIADVEREISQSRQQAAERETGREADRAETIAEIERRRREQATAERQPVEPAAPGRPEADREPEQVREVVDPIRRHEMQGELDRAAREDEARRGDQRTKEERREGISIDDEEAARRAIGKLHDRNKDQDRGTPNAPDGTLTAAPPTRPNIQESTVSWERDAAKVREAERAEQRQDRRDERAQDRAADNVRPGRARNYEEARREAERDHYNGWLQKQQTESRQQLREAQGKLVYAREAERAHAEKQPILFGKEPWRLEQQQLKTNREMAERREREARERVANPKTEYERWCRYGGGNAEQSQHIRDYCQHKYPEHVKTRDAELQRELQQQRQRMAEERERRHAREQQRGHDRGGRER